MVGTITINHTVHCMPHEALFLWTGSVTNGPAVQWPVRSAGSDRGPGDVDGRLRHGARRLARGVETEETEAVGDGRRRGAPSGPVHGRGSPREELLDGGPPRGLGALRERSREGVGCDGGGGGGGDGALLAGAGGGRSERGREGEEEEGGRRAGGGLGDARPVLPGERDGGGGGAERGGLAAGNRHQRASPCKRPTEGRRSGVQVHVDGGR